MFPLATFVLSPHDTAVVGYFLIDGACGGEGVEKEKLEKRAGCILV